MRGVHAWGCDSDASRRACRRSGLYRSLCRDRARPRGRGVCVHAARPGGQRSPRRLHGGARWWRRGQVLQTPRRGADVMWRPPPARRRLKSCSAPQRRRPSAALPTSTASRRRRREPEHKECAMRYAVALARLNRQWNVVSLVEVSGNSRGSFLPLPPCFQGRSHNPPPPPSPFHSPLPPHSTSPSQYAAEVAEVRDDSDRDHVAAATQPPLPRTYDGRRPVGGNPVSTPLRGGRTTPTEGCAARQRPRPNADGPLAAPHPPHKRRPLVCPISPHTPPTFLAPPSLLRGEPRWRRHRLRLLLVRAPSRPQLAERLVHLDTHFPRWD